MIMKKPPPKHDIFLFTCCLQSWTNFHKSYKLRDNTFTTNKFFCWM